MTHIIQVREIQLENSVSVSHPKAAEHPGSWCLLQGGFGVSVSWGAVCVLSVVSHSLRPVDCSPPGSSVLGISSWQVGSLPLSH